MSGYDSNNQKSALLNLKRVIHGVSKNNKNYSKFSFDQATSVTLLEELTKNIENARGTTLTIFHTRAQTKDGSREFDSGYAFLDGIQEPRQGFGGQGNAPTQFKRTTTTQQPVSSVPKSVPAAIAPTSQVVGSNQDNGGGLKARIAKLKQG